MQGPQTKRDKALQILARREERREKRILRRQERKERRQNNVLCIPEETVTPTVM